MFIGDVVDKGYTKETEKVAKEYRPTQKEPEQYTLGIVVEIGARIDGECSHAPQEGRHEQIVYPSEDVPPWLRAVINILLHHAFWLCNDFHILYIAASE